MLSRRSFLAPAALAPAVFTQSRSGQTPPNVLIILTDDQGYGDFSCHGNPVLKTPNMDRLHAESVRFTDFHVAPMCTPTRGQLLTGMDALHNRATSVTAGRAVVQQGIPLMPEIFRASGYTTGLFGKWHIGDNYPYRPMDRGFDEAMYHLGWGLSSAPEFDNDYFNGRYRHNGTVKQFDGYCTDFWFREAMRWMGAQQTKRQPFLCYLPTNAPHGPLWVDAKYSDPYKKPGQPAAFFGMIANLDENLGKLDAFLKETGLRDNTIVVFMTDNGATAGRNVFNAGMREAKTSVYDGGHRVPCFVRWPKGGLRAAGDVNAPTQIQDILPTLIDLCQLKRPAGAQFDGRSLAGVLRGQTALPDRMLVVQYGQILKPFDSNVIWNQWRLVKGTELYDFREDPGEQKDLANIMPDVARKMRTHYEKWWAAIEPTLRDFCPIGIGAPQENPVELSSSDWEEIYCDNHRQVSEAAGGPRGGPWNVHVERAGAYDIALARWPFRRALALDAPCSEKKMTVATLPAGKALPIAGAQLRIAGLAQAAKSTPGAQAIVMRVQLPPGKTKLHAWFQDAAGHDLSGAFYARVRRV